MNGNVNVGDTAALIISGNTDRKKMKMKNDGSNTVFLGSDTSVTISTGFPLLTNEELLNNDYTGDWYGICDTSEDTDVMFFEEVI